MKIAFVNDTFLAGRGADTAIYEIARRLGKKNNVYVICGESDFKEDNFEIIKINTKKLLGKSTLKNIFNYFGNIARFRKEILRLDKKYHFDVFNIYHSALNPAFKGLPAVVTCNGSPPSRNFARNALNKMVLNTLGWNKKTITISEYLKTTLPKNVFKKTTVIYDGVSEEFRQVWKDGNYMLFVGRHEPHKNVDELIKLSTEIKFPLIIAGSGPLTEKLKDYAKKINAKDVFFAGRVERKRLVSLYQKCSFFISASEWEGFGLIFLEAGACGKPSVAYNRCSMPEVILNKKTGLLAKNYIELREMAGNLAHDGKTRIIMGRNALKYSKEFSWEIAAKKYMEVFNKAIGK